MNATSLVQRHFTKYAVMALLGLILASVLCTYTPTPPPKKGFVDDWTGLFVAVTKGFSGDTCYLGSDDEWAYFRSGRFFPVYRKVAARKMNLSPAFQFGEDKPFPIKLSDFVGYEAR